MPAHKKFNNYEILSDGKTVKIELNSRKYGIKYGFCDLEDWDYLKEYSWHLHKNTKKLEDFYISTTIYYNKTGKPGSVQMHTLILNPPNKMLVNHKDFNGLNCCKFNIEICSKQENNHYSRKRKDNTSGYKGVCWDKDCEKWSVSIAINGKQKKIGRFRNIIEAAKAYNESAIKYFGKFAVLNEFEDKP